MESNGMEGSGLSAGALSHMYKQQTAFELLNLRKFQNLIVGVLVALSIALVVFSCYWSWIIGKREAYDDPASDWENCLLAADYAYVPLTSIFGQVSTAIEGAQTSLQTCIPTQIDIFGGNCSVQCVTDLNNQCFSALTGLEIPEVTDPQLPQGSYLYGLISISTKTIVFGAIAQALLYRGLRHPSWLLFSSVVCVYLTVCILSYYTIAPVIPIPGKVNSTLISYIHYSYHHTSKFSNYNDGDNKCLYGRRIVWCNLALMLGVVGCTVIAAAMSIYAEFRRYKSPNKKLYTHLSFTEVPLFLAGLGLLCYFLSLGAKLVVAVTQLNAIADYDTPESEVTSGLWYNQLFNPLPSGELDVPTLVGVFACMSIVRGFTIQSLSAFKVALICALLFCMLLYAPVTGAWEFYDYNSFIHYDDCYNYFLNPKTTSAFGYPDENQAKTYCLATRVSVSALTSMFAVMHLVAGACGVMIWINSKDGRDSLFHEPVDFDSASLRSGSTKPAGPTTRNDPLLQNSFNN